MAAPKLNAFLAALLKQVQNLENAAFSIMTARFLGFAIGEQLDMLGRLVGEKRYGRTDDNFRKGIRLRIYINGSSGRPEDLIFVAKALTGLTQVKYIDVGPGVCRLYIPGWVPDSGALLAFLQKICPGGVRLLSVTNVEFYSPKRMGERMNTPFSHA